MLAGMEDSHTFHEKREACIRRKYDADETGQRILNGDGGSWIKDPYDPDVIFQSDRYHICQEVLRKVSDKKAQQDIRVLLEEEMLEYIRIYADSVESPDEKNMRSKKARELLKYLENNKQGLLPYDKQVIEILSAAKAPKKDGKGNSHADIINHHMPLLDAMQTAGRKAFKRAFIG
ncbi:MAG: UPF0236 family protein [Lachnospiraceae bacterium]|nr:UPF0236 family protein [Butyrivibrio sp.]MCM1345168.1 UPF0236 family protein [Muribaculaceae bacterium]MCM1412375.1 UPF0236 family protein [Lachnospiraceae bacterium]MCM1543069.1 UPF0236 family protein [Blautia sp.]